MALRGRPATSWGGILVALAFGVAACSATPTASPPPAPSPAPTGTSSATATGSPGPISSLPAGCDTDAHGSATAPRVSIADLAAQGYADYDVLIFDFDRGLPEYTIGHVEPPFTSDPSGKPLTVAGASFFSIVFHGASIVDEEFQPVYEGPTDFQPSLQRIQQVVLSGDFEAVSSWIVGLHGPACLAAQTFSGKRLVVAFLDAP